MIYSNNPAATLFGTCMYIHARFWVNISSNMLALCPVWYAGRFAFASTFPHISVS